MIETDYTKEAKKDTLLPGYMQGYRVIHWLRDIVKNFFSSPINIRDERICGLFRFKDGETDEQFNAMFRVDLPYSERGIVKAGITPCILVSEGETAYNVQAFNVVNTNNISELGGIAKYHGLKHRTTKAQIAVVTESYDSTLLLKGLLEDFLIMHEVELATDCGSIDQFLVLGSSAPQAVQVGADANAKQLYQAVITVSMTGGLSWITDTQGPVFRGLRTKQHISR